MGPEALAQVLRPLASLFPGSAHPDLLVGLDLADDAAVWRVSEELALVVTTDFFTPIVDEPYDYGAIAAANAMSDVFAMGGEVMLALNLVAFPEDLPAETGAEIVRGGAETVRAAGGVVAGGHSVNDPEPKFGLAVIGRVHPEQVLRTTGARPGDVLLLSKPIGTGLVTTALKRGEAEPEHLAAAVRSMKALNRAAGAAARELAASAVTDVTGFGLLGHAMEMAEHGGVALEIDVAALPLLPGALDYARAGMAPGGTARNRAAFGARVEGIDKEDPLMDLLFDPQTSGGLLVAIAPEAEAAFRSALAAEGEEARAIGRVREGRGIRVHGA